MSVELQILRAAAKRETFTVNEIAHEVDEHTPIARFVRHLVEFERVKIVRLAVGGSPWSNGLTRFAITTKGIARLADLERRVRPGDRLAAAAAVGGAE